jgi:hypothetical protein
MNLTHAFSPAKNVLIRPAGADSAFKGRYTLDIRLIMVIGFARY